MRTERECDRSMAVSSSERVREFPVSSSGKEKKPKKVKKERKKRKNPSDGRVRSSSHPPSSSRHGVEDGVGSAYHSERGERVDGSVHSGSKRDRERPGPKKGKKRKEEKKKARAEAAAAEKDDLSTSMRRSAKLSSSRDGYSSKLSSSERPAKKSKKNKAQQLQDQHATAAGGYSARQLAVNDMMRLALEEDAYSALGSVVDTESSEDEEESAVVIPALASTGPSSRKGGSVSSAIPPNSTRLDRTTIAAAMKKRLRMESMRHASSYNRSGGANVVDSSCIKSPGTVMSSPQPHSGDGEDDDKSKKGKKRKGGGIKNENDGLSDEDAESGTEDGGPVDGEDEGSIFGQTTGSSNATWVECDRCKKWRRLRGVVDAKKLPSKWYCSMNKNDPERSKCTAPEEEYDTPNTPESAADHRTRKHLRLWVRRLQCNEAYEARLPTMTRHKKRSATTSAKEPYEWVRCCNPSCGKWRAILRFMDSSTVIESAKNGEWYCVLNTWDEKTASCAAPQENLPAIGCPPWVMQDEE